jgi:hypothetical protein
MLIIIIISTKRFNYSKFLIRYIKVSILITKSNKIDRNIDILRRYSSGVLVTQFDAFMFYVLVNYENVGGEGAHRIVLLCSLTPECNNQEHM